MEIPDAPSAQSGAIFPAGAHRTTPDSAHAPLHVNPYGTSMTSTSTPEAAKRRRRKGSFNVQIRLVGGRRCAVQTCRQKKGLPMPQTRSASNSNFTHRYRFFAIPSVGILALGTAALLILPNATAGAATPSVGLGTADSYAVLAGTTVTNTGPSMVSGSAPVPP